MDFANPKIVLSTGQICVGPQFDEEVEKELALSYTLAQVPLPPPLLASVQCVFQYLTTCTFSHLPCILDVGA